MLSAVTLKLRPHLLACAICRRRQSAYAITELQPLRGQAWRNGESARLSSMWPGFDFRSQRHMWAEFVAFLPYSGRFSSGSSGFDLSPETNI